MFEPETDSSVDQEKQIVELYLSLSTMLET